VKRQTLNAIEISKEKYSELKEKYEKVQGSNKTIENKKNIWKIRLQELKDQSLETLKNVNNKYEQLKEKTQNVIKKQQEIWQTKIKELLEDIRKIDEAESEDK
jgi:FtsZ-binding cell division protein ZapB